MRIRRLSAISLAFYIVFIGGSAYYNLIFPVRFFHHFLITVLAVFWLFRRFRRDGLPVTGLNTPLYGAVVVWGIATAFSVDPRMALEHTWFSLLHLLIFFVLVDLIQRGRGRLVLEIQFLLGAVVVIISGMELLSWYFGLGFIPGTETGWLDVIGPDAWLPLKPLTLSLAMNISTLLAGYVAPLITLTIGWALTARRRDYRQVLWLLAVALVVVLVLTVSRGGLLSLGAALATFTALRFFQEPQVIRRIPPWLLIGAPTAAVLAVAVILVLRQEPFTGDKGRIDMYESAVEMVADYPVTGVGPGIYGRVFRDYRTPGLARDKLASAHNLYLNTAAETGILGIAVGLWLMVALGRRWWRVWRAQNTTACKIRQEAAMAAVIGVAVHSLVDVFTVTSVVSVILVILAYSVTGHKTVLDDRRAGHRFPALIGIIIALAYGAFFWQIDRAQAAYHRSLLEEGAAAIQSAQEAERIDPSLNLYDLQITYLLGQEALESGNPTDLQGAVTAYETALELEPTWQRGWINLAALELAQDQPERAVDDLTRAQTIHNQSPAGLQKTRLLDDLDEDPETVIARYVRDMNYYIAWARRLPLSDFWTATPLRRQALEDYLGQANSNPEIQYRVWAVHDPNRAASLVPEDPRSAVEWWISGEHALTVLGQTDAAESSFREAIAKDRTNGDYYVSLAKTLLERDPQEAERYLKIGQLLDTKYEYPNAILSLLADTQEEADHLLATALPSRRVGQEFAAVLYGGRAAAFDVPVDFRFPGPGEAAMQPWYTLARQYEAEGALEDAKRVYRAIVQYAPDEAQACSRLEQLEN